MFFSREGEGLIARGEGGGIYPDEEGPHTKKESSIKKGEGGGFFLTVEGGGVTDMTSKFPYSK